MSIVVVGNTVVDLVFPNLTRLPSWPRHTEFTPTNLVFPPEPPIVSLGGNGANAAYAAARCGATVTLHTQLGADALGGLARDWLAQAGCRVKPGQGVVTHFASNNCQGRSGVPAASGRGLEPASTFKAKCVTTGRGAATAVNVTATNRRHRRATLFYPGADIAMPKIPAGGGAPSHLLVCGWPHPPLADIAAGLHRARRRGIFTALDAGPILGQPWTLAALRGVFKNLDLFIANEHEALSITRRRALPEALHVLRKHFQGQVVIKRGARGALWLPADSGKAHRVPAPKVKAFSTVGAGDAFNGALIAMLSRGTPWPAALRSAAATAASAVASPRGILGLIRGGAARLPRRSDAKTGPRDAYGP